MATVPKKQAIIEALKEAGRLLLLGVLGAIPGVVTYFTGLITDPVINVALSGFVTVILKSIDKLVHKLDSTEKNGITGF